MTDNKRLQKIPRENATATGDLGPRSVNILDCIPNFMFSARGVKTFGWIAVWFSLGVQLYAIYMRLDLTVSELERQARYGFAFQVGLGSLGFAGIVAVMCAEAQKKLQTRIELLEERSARPPND